MTSFIQLHMLTSYPPSNLNRDDLGRPKTAVMGGVQRLRISSQSLKRAWRTSPTFQHALKGQLGIRTKRLGSNVYQALLTGQDFARLLEESPSSRNEAPPEVALLPDEQARNLAWSIASVFVDKPRKASGERDEEEDANDHDEAEPSGTRKKGKKDEAKSNVDKKTLESEQLVFYSTAEIQGISDTINAVLKTKIIPGKKTLRTLVRDHHRDADLAMFGRMLASAPTKCVEAAVQVGHAISAHKVTVEDDYFSAVDDLNLGMEDMGAAHIGETAYAAGLFYLYICIDADLLQKNLQGDAELTARTLRALTEAAATIAPTGKQNSFASRAYASYILAEKGTRQPRSLSVAFLKPVTGPDMLNEAIAAITGTRANMDRVYGKLWDADKTVNALQGEGNFEDLLDFVAPPPKKKDGQ